MGIFIDGNPIDVFTSENHQFDGTVTSDPVENGIDIADNITLMPATLTVTGVVSDTPREQVGDPDVYGQKAYDFLLEIRLEKRLVTVETDLAVYKDMGLVSLTMPRDSRSGDALTFTAVFKQIKYVSTARAIIRVEQPRNNKKQKRKIKPAEQLNESVDRLVGTNFSKAKQRAQKATANKKLRRLPR